jgi:hypothetical protein
MISFVSQTVKWGVEIGELRSSWAAVAGDASFPDKLLAVHLTDTSKRGTS